MILPTRLNTNFSTVQNTQSRHTNQTLQRAKNANALPTQHSFATYFLIVQIKTEKL